jgi:hypothetical protein
MSEVTSVNSKTGEVVLKAADVEAVATSEIGQPNGVASLNGGGELPEAQLPSSVVSSGLKELGEVEGKVAPNLAEGNVFLLTAKGNVTIEPPTGTVPRPEYSVVMVLAENSSGGHTFTFSGFTLLGEEPKLVTTANAVNRIELWTDNSGATWYYVGLQAGKEGPAGPTGSSGAEGPEGFVPSHLLLPSEFPTWKGVAETAEKRQVLAESYQRTYTNAGGLTLTSGTPVIVAIPIKAKEVIRGIGFGVQTIEGTAVNRTHLWVALLKANGEKVAESADYTSSTSNGFANGEKKAIRFTASYEAKANEVLYAVVCEVMSSTNCITLDGFNSAETIMAEEVPILNAVGPASLTTPASLTSPVTISKSTPKTLPWLCFV